MVANDEPIYFEEWMKEKALQYAMVEELKTIEKMKLGTWLSYYRGRRKLFFCRLEDQLADIMTKLLKIEKFREMRTFLIVDPLPEKLNI